MPINAINNAFEDYKTLINNLELEVFCKKFENSSSVGAHVRHVLDRANCVVEGFKNSKIDYDNRRRQIELEQNPKLCLKEFERIFKELKNFSQDPKSEVEVSETENQEGLKVKLKSTFEREFWDIVLHTIHHLATIKFILEKSGVLVDKDLGKNVSTVIYERCVNNKFS